jgi:hypothetical protein
MNRAFLIMGQGVTRHSRLLLAPEPLAHYVPALLAGHESLNGFQTRERKRYEHYPRKTLHVGFRSP